MADFSPTESALEGFRIAKERPGIIGVLALLQIFVSLVVIGLLIASAGPQLAELMTMSQDPTGMEEDPEAVAAFMAEIFSGMAPAFAAIFVIGLLVQAVQASAIMRVVLRPSEASPGYLRLGGDELRVLVVMVAKSLLFTVVGFIIGIALGIVGALMGAFGVLIAVLGIFAMIGGLIYVAVRLSLAVPQTFAERRIMVFESWAMTQGIFWKVFGCYLLTFVLYVAVLFIGAIASGAITAIFALMTGSSMDPDFTSLASYFTVAQIVNTLLGAVIGALGLAIMGSPPAVIYKRLSGHGEAEVF